MKSDDNCENLKYSDITKYVYENNIPITSRKTKKGFCSSINKWNKKSHSKIINFPNDEVSDENDEEFEVYVSEIKNHKSGSMKRLLKMTKYKEGENILNNFEAYKILNNRILRYCKNYSYIKNDKDIKEFIKIIGNEKGIEYIFPLECLVKNIFATIGEKIETDNMGMQMLSKEFSDYFRPVNKIASGADGDVYSSGLLGYNRPGEIPIFILKKARGDEKKFQQQIHEVVVSMILQETLTNLCESEDSECRPVHNYMYSYGGFFCGGNKMICENDKNMVFYSLNEYIHGGDFESKMKEMTIEEKIGYIIYIIKILRNGQFSCGFMHNDLHVKNVYLKKSNIIEEIRLTEAYDEEIFVKLRDIPVIIDYGQATVIMNDKVIKSIKYGKKRNVPETEWYYETYDIFFFIYTMILILAFDGYKKDAIILTDICMSYWYEEYGKRGLDLEEYMYKCINNPERYELMHPDKLVDKYLDVFNKGSMNKLQKHIGNRVRLGYS